MMPNKVSDELDQFVSNVRSYCVWVESAPHDLLAVRQILLELMRAIPALKGAYDDESEIDGDYPRREYKEWKVDHKKFQDIPAQYYQEVFDPTDLDNKEILTGDLHDDFADIYGDLWHGLQALIDGDRDYALFHWRTSYFWHWGEHASSAIRVIDHLYRERQQF